MGDVVTHKEIVLHMIPQLNQISVAEGAAFFDLMVDRALDGASLLAAIQHLSPEDAAGKLNLDAADTTSWTLRPPPDTSVAQSTLIVKRNRVTHFAPTTIGLDVRLAMENLGGVLDAGTEDVNDARACCGGGSAGSHGM